ncbi:MAG: aminotransferase class I/II-fold pyridoxal phosphate-dependent enzyme [Salinarimonas sp.]
MRDHGGDLDRARAAYGGAAGEWIDLSTGINRVPYPMPTLGPADLCALPQRAALDDLIAAARDAYETRAAILPLAGAQAAIQLVPRLVRDKVTAQGAIDARVLSPTYNEHAGALSGAGIAVREVAEASDLAGADVAILVNPNNPDGCRHGPAKLLALAEQVGLLVVDESFADAEPDLTLIKGFGETAPANVLVLRSFGKFYGLAGLRLGFALGASPLIARLEAMAGPWAVSGPAIAAGRIALRDAPWRTRTIARLTEDCARLDALAIACGWGLVGGTALFRTYAIPGGAAAAQDALARRMIWSRIFPYAPDWLRLGLPGAEGEWRRLEAALPGSFAGAKSTR